MKSKQKIKNMETNNSAFQNLITSDGNIVNFNNNIKSNLDDGEVGSKLNVEGKNSNCNTPVNTANTTLNTSASSSKIKELELSRRIKKDL
jgi:hypothetical protein